MSRECNRASLARLTRLCAILHDRPELWLLYEDTFRDTIEAMARTLDEHEAKLAFYSAHTPINRFGKPMARGGRAHNCKRWAWDNKPHVCEECGIELTRAIMTPHHIVPVFAGGDDSPENLIVLCANCHAEKHNKSKYDD